MNARELRDLGLFIVGVEDSDRLTRLLLRGWSRAAQVRAGRTKAVFWVAMSILCSIGIGQLH
jgi:hypothetical protein